MKRKLVAEMLVLFLTALMTSLYYGFKLYGDLVTT